MNQAAYAEGLADDRDRWRETARVAQVEGAALRAEVERLRAVADAARSLLKWNDSAARKPSSAALHDALAALDGTEAPRG